MTVAAFIAIYFVHLAAVMSPGPAVLLVARTALREGMRNGVYLSLGLGIGTALWMLCSLFGLTLLFNLAPAFLIGFKIIGAAYLLYIAYKMWKHSAEPLFLEGAEDLPQNSTPRELIRLGITTQLANPKSALFFGTVFLTLIPAATPTWLKTLLVLIVFINQCGWSIIISRIFSLETTRGVYLKLKKIIDRVCGGLLAALSAKLLLN